MFSLKRQRTVGEGPQLAGPRIVLRAPRMEDHAAWSELRAESRDFLKPWEPTWPRDALTTASFRRRLRTQSRERQSGSGCALFAFRRDDAQLLGGLTIADIRKGVAMSCTFGYWIGARHARQGYMTEAVAVALDHVFGTLGLHRVEAACLPENEPSQRLLRRLGFVEEGLARGYLRIDGRWRDHLLFAMLDGDWAGAKRALGAGEGDAAALEAAS